MLSLKRDLHFPWYMTVVIWFSIKASLHTHETIVFYRFHCELCFPEPDALKENILPLVPSSIIFTQPGFLRQTGKLSDGMVPGLHWYYTSKPQMRGCQELPVLQHLIYALQMWKEFPGGIRETMKAIQIRTQRNITLVFCPVTVFSFTLGQCRTRLRPAVVLEIWSAEASPDCVCPWCYEWKAHDFPKGELG